MPNCPLRGLAVTNPRSEACIFREKRPQRRSGIRLGRASRSSSRQALPIGPAWRVIRRPGGETSRTGRSASGRPEATRMFRSVTLRSSTRACSSRQAGYGGRGDCRPAARPQPIPHPGPASGCPFCPRSFPSGPVPRMWRRVGGETTTAALKGCRRFVDGPSDVPRRCAHRHPGCRCRSIVRYLRGSH